MKTIQPLISILMLGLLTTTISSCDEEDVGDAVDEAVFLTALQTGQWYYEDIGDIPDEDFNCLHFEWLRFEEDNSITIGEVNDVNNCNDITTIENHATWELMGSTTVRITYNSDDYEEYRNIEFPGNSRMRTDVRLTSGRIQTTVFEHNSRMKIKHNLHNQNI